MIVLVTGISMSKTRAEENRQPNFVIGNDAMIRFSFQPKNEDFLRPALIFHVALAGDQHWNTAPIGPIGRSPYISVAEMKLLADRLSHSGLEWHVSTRAKEIVPYIKLPINDNMQITVFTSSGTATADLPPDRICGVLATLNTAISTPRAHWEFEFFQRMYHCSVQNFDPYSYPDHY